MTDLDLEAILTDYLNKLPDDAPAGTVICCPIAMALRSNGYPLAMVGPDELYLGGQHERRPLSADLQRFVYAVDCAIRRTQRLGEPLEWSRITAAQARALLAQAREEAK